MWGAFCANPLATLLLVGDAPIILDILREALVPTGHRMLTVTNGRGRHRGSIGVEDSADGGSVCVFAFPLDPQDSMENAACAQ
jgi:hypothetical protein